MKEQYIVPEVKLIGFVASEKIAAQGTLTWEGFGEVITSGTTNVSQTDIRIPLKLV